MCILGHNHICANLYFYVSQMAVYSDMSVRIFSKKKFPPFLDCQLCKGTVSHMTETHKNINEHIYDCV